LIDKEPLVMVQKPKLSRWRVQSYGLKRVCKNPVITSPNKKSVSTELFIDSTAAIKKEIFGCKLGPMRVISDLALADWRGK